MADIVSRIAVLSSGTRNYRGNNHLIAVIELNEFDARSNVGLLHLFSPFIYLYASILIGNSNNTGFEIARIALANGLIYRSV